MRLTSTLGFVSLLALLTAPALADAVGQIEDGVSTPNAAPTTGTLTSTTRIGPDFATRLIATGSDPLENPSGIITNFGRLSGGTPTEPDENTYLVLRRNPGGPAAGFDYGRHFLFQGHENGSPTAYITRINLDVPRGDIHRITLLTPINPATGTTGFGSIDGSSYNPFTNTMLFTQEAGTNGGVIQVTLNWPPQVNTLDPFLGKAAYEGIHTDDKGTIYMAEDTGGATSNTTSPVNLNKGRQPNSFIYRYVPNNPKRIEDGGKLQALQVIIDGSPIVFGGTAARDADIASTAQLKLHTPNTSYPIKWVTIHTSNPGDFAPFDANAAAKAASATPFKRPENLAWLPGSDFNTFFFDATGDTDAVAGENPFLQARGSYGAIFRVDLGRSADHESHGGLARDEGRISLFFLGDHDHNSFDNLSFANNHQLLAAEDRGDTLHDQLNTLDSVWAFDVRGKNPHPLRFIALGRDPLSAPVGFEDNEPTGVYVSNGSTEVSELLGTEQSLDGRARGFFTQQHGENNVFEFFRTRGERHVEK
jgi:hypothetical protein